MALALDHFPDWLKHNSLSIVPWIEGDIMRYFNPAPKDTNWMLMSSRVKKLPVLMTQTESAKEDTLHATLIIDRGEYNDNQRRSHSLHSWTCPVQPPAIRHHYKGHFSKWIFRFTKYLQFNKRIKEPFAAIHWWRIQTLTPFKRTIIRRRRRGLLHPSLSQINPQVELRVPFLSSTLIPIRLRFPLSFHQLNR